MYSGSTSGQASGAIGFTFKVTFDAAYKGKAWTLTGDGTTLNGTVPDSNYVEITVLKLNTQFVLSGDGFSKDLMSGAYYGYSFATVSAVQPTFGDNTWAQISQASASGQAANLWHAGDAKTIHLQGTIGTLSVNQDVNVFILGINHNSAKEGNNLIHMQIGKNTSGNPIAFCDSNYNSSVSSTGYFSMNSSNTNVGGWNATQMRNTILHSGTAPTSAGNNTFMSVLPADLRAVMKPCTKYTDNTGGGSGASSNVTSTTEYLTLLSEFEVQGTRTYANQYEQNSQAQYDYYKAGNSKIFNGTGSQSSAVIWWLRSPYYGISNTFCRVGTNGGANYNIASSSYGVSPALFV